MKSACSDQWESTAFTTRPSSGLGDGQEFPVVRVKIIRGKVSESTLPVRRLLYRYADNTGFGILMIMQKFEEPVPNPGCSAITAIDLILIHDEIGCVEKHYLFPFSRSH